LHLHDVSSLGQSICLHAAAEKVRASGLKRKKQNARVPRGPVEGVETQETDGVAA